MTADLSFAGDNFGFGQVLLLYPTLVSLFYPKLPYLVSVWVVGVIIVYVYFWQSRLYL